MGGVQLHKLKSLKVLLTHSVSQTACCRLVSHIQNPPKYIFVQLRCEEYAREAAAMQDTIAQEKQKYATLTKKMETMASIARAKYMFWRASHTLFFVLFFLLFFFFL